MTSLIGFTACEIDDLPNPNGASVNDLLRNATKSDLQTLVTGTESLMRNDLGFYYDVTAIIGREYWVFTGSDPRYTGELLGRENSQLDNAGFYGTRPFAARYRTVKNANILIEAATNSQQISEQERNAYFGFAKTMQAYELTLVLNLQYQNGIRMNVKDPDDLGPFLSYEESLAGIAALLDEAARNLENAGSDFPFVLSSGFEGFDAPDSFLEFNRALAARIAVYQGNKQNANKFLGDSFFDLDGDFYAGPFLSFSTAGGEQTNPVFRPRNQADGIIAHPSFVEALTEGDDRVSKIARRDAPASLDGLTGEYDVVVFPSLTAPIHLIRNEELILIYAEANIGINNAESERALNIIRAKHGLDAISGLTEAQLLDEVLAQRRFSLYAEGHRWVDLRRYNRLAELPIDRPGDDVWTQLPRPVTEN